MQGNTINIGQIRPIKVPEALNQAYDPPQQLYAIGEGMDAILGRPRLAVVGSRKVTPYGMQVTRSLVKAIAARGVVIVSGLAYGIDGLAHQAALEAGGTTVAILAGGLDDIYPHRHHGLARQIVGSGGMLLSEYETGVPPLKHHFIARNRLIAGLADGVLIPEAAERSGSLHTADFAIQMNKEVYAVPGNITSASSAGTNRLLQDGAKPVYDLADLLNYLGLPATNNAPDSTEPQHLLLKLINQGVNSTADLQAKSGLETAALNHQLTVLEITGHIKSSGPSQWSA